jgi:hypothetical protein
LELQLFVMVVEVLLLLLLKEPKFCSGYKS